MTVERLLQEIKSFGEPSLNAEWRGAFESLISKLDVGSLRTGMGTREYQFYAKLKKYRDELK